MKGTTKWITFTKKTLLFYTALNGEISIFYRKKKIFQTPVYNNLVGQGWGRCRGKGHRWCATHSNSIQRSKSSPCPATEAVFIVSSCNTGLLNTQPLKMVKAQVGSQCQRMLLRNGRNKCTNSCIRESSHPCPVSYYRSSTIGCPR